MAGGFDALGLSAALLLGVQEMGWALPTDVQDEAIPLILGGGDVMAAAETGSGKTAAFALPVLQVVEETIGGGGLGGSEGAAETISGVGMNDDDKDTMLIISSSSSPAAAAEGSSGSAASASGASAGGRAKNKRGKERGAVSKEDEAGERGRQSNGAGIQTLEASGNQWMGCRATHGVTGGKYCFEVVVLSDGIARVGFSSLSATRELGKDANGFGYGGTAKKSHMNKFEDYGETYGVGDVIGCFVNFKDRCIEFTKNGEELGKAFDIPQFLVGKPLYPAVALKNCTVQVNFGRHPFQFRPIAGYNPICQASAEHAAIGLTMGGVAPRTSNRSPLAIVLEPARDLAEQTYDAFVSLSKYMTDPEVRSVLIVGGDDDKKINRDLSQGCDVIVATPGKLEALIKKGVVDVSAVRFLVLDEADRLIETENTRMILELYDMIPKGGVGTHRLQVCFFSATLHSDPVQELSSRICFNPTWVDLKGKDSVPETVHHAVVMIDPTDEQLQQQIAAQLTTRAITDGVHAPQELKGNSPEAQQARYSQAIKEIKQHMLIQLIDKLQMDQCLIFCRTNVDCSNLERFMLECGGGGGKFRGKQEKGKENPYSCCVLAGMRSMEERRANLQAFKDGDVRFLICTDVAARGIDIKNLPYVINMTLPDEPESYIHRVGRVGRAEAMGLAISLVAAPGFKEKVWFHTCSSKGKGGNCTRRTLVEEGGCTIWYDEPAYFTAIEQRLGTSIPRLGPDLSLPPEFATNVKYGETLADAQAPQTNVHLDLLQPTVKELAEIEIHAQNIYHNLRFRFA